MRLDDEVFSRGTGNPYGDWNGWKATGRGSLVEGLSSTDSRQSFGELVVFFFLVSYDTSAAARLCFAVYSSSSSSSAWTVDNAIPVGVSVSEGLVKSSKSIKVFLSPGNATCSSNKTLGILQRKSSA